MTGSKHGFAKSTFLDELFTKYAESSYDKVVGEWSQYRILQNNAFEQLKHCNRTGDIGCGTGNLTTKLAKMGVNVTAIDSNEMMLSKLRDKVQREGLENKVEILQKDIDEEIDLPANIDGVAMLNVLYCVEDPYKTLDNIFASLKAGGRLVLTGPKPNKNPGELFEHMIDEFKRKGKYDKLKDDIQTVIEVNEFLAQQMKQRKMHLFTTERLKEVLLNFVGFSDLVVSDLRDPDYKTYLGQSHFLSVRKKVDYNTLDFNQINIRLATKEEVPLLFRIRYHIMKERLRILNPTPEQEKLMAEFDEFDEHSQHLLAEYDGKILAIFRVTEDSKERKLPLDKVHDLDGLRTGGNSLWEPGRLIKLPFGLRGIARLVYRAGYEYTRINGATHWAGFYDERNVKLFRRMGYKMEQKIPTKVPEFDDPYFEIFECSNPPHFFEEPLHPIVVDFLKSLP